jgi:hypothetical protein
MPNLYFLARLLELEPLVSQLIFTEARGGDDGYHVGSCPPDELRRQIERTLPSYAVASRSLRMPSELDLADPAQAQQLGDAFKALLQALPQASGRDDDPAHGWVTSERIRSLAAGLLSTSAIETVATTLSDEDVRLILESPYRFVPATSGGRVTGLVDREAVALAVARTALREGAQ